MNEAMEVLDAVLGLGRESRELGAGQMMARAAVIYVATLVLVRLGKKRFFGRATALDIIIGIMLGSVVGRAITGNAPFLPALAAGAALIAMHWLFSLVALHWRGFGVAIKGRSRVLIRDGAVREEALRRSHITQHDLMEDLRSKGLTSPDGVAEARLERSGNLSVIKREAGPRVVSVEVREGVQTVRIELS